MSLAQPGALAVAFCHPIPSGGDGGKVAGGGHRPGRQRVPYAAIPSLLRQEGSTAATVLATSGVHGRAVPCRPAGWWSRARRPGHPSDAGRGQGLVGADAYLTALDTKGLREDGPDCAPSFWRDATTLVCEFKQITVTTDYKKVVKTEDLVPKNDRVPPVPSPDGKSFAFLSTGRAGSGRCSAGTSRAVPSR
ncbi:MULTISPECIES: hypothetical protein [Streptomyces]|uniref:hypothetical protein n=1 Tax=Streptomyces TaxID=1883 RepID=UPI000B0B55B4|nr:MULTISPECIES: hypothetical protein [Streptomyces]